MSPPIQKLITDAEILSVVLERMIRFPTTVDVVLEEYNNCLPITNDWVLNMFG